MLETDAGRLAGIRFLDASLARAPRGTLEGQFQNGYAEVDADGIAVEGSVPSLICRTSDVARLAIEKTTRLEIDGTTYVVAREEPDGYGMSRLVLRR